MTHKFSLNKTSLLRKFAVYVVVAYGKSDVRLYIGKTGDNREGCNPIISRCGNHFSYNKVHSQVRNKIKDHEERDYTYIFDHFGDYFIEKTKRQRSIDEINEMERWLNQEVQDAIIPFDNCKLVNPFLGKGYVSKKEQSKRAVFRTDNNQKIINGIVGEVIKDLRVNHSQVKAG